jgi:hypothetical protein
MKNERKTIQVKSHYGRKQALRKSFDLKGYVLINSRPCGKSSMEFTFKKGN